MPATNLHPMAGRHVALGQKNFALGEVKAVFERWCAANGYREREVFFAALIAFQAMDHEARSAWFDLVEKWAADGFKTDAKGVSTVVKTVGCEGRPVEKTPTRESRRATA
jgi:hypothetical protein